MKDTNTAAFAGNAVSPHVTFVGWVAFIGGMYFLSKSRTGYAFIYYSLILILVLLVVGNYKAITSALITN